MKSPFTIVQNFLSPGMCEQIVADIEVKEPNRDKDGVPTSLTRTCLHWEYDLAERFRDVVPEIEERYNSTYRALEQPQFQFFPENAKNPAQKPGCENARFLRKKWVQVKDVDLVGFVWLKDFNDNIPLDPRFEVFGGKLEFPLYDFSLVPQRGTLVIFPAGPHFITTISPVLVSDLYQVKLNICMNTKDGGRWLYQPANFPGSWGDWFEGHF